MYTNIRLYMCAVFRFCASYSRIILNLPRSSYTDRLDKFFPMILDCFDLPLLYFTVRCQHVAVPVTDGWWFHISIARPSLVAGRFFWARQIHKTQRCIAHRIERALAIDLHGLFFGWEVEKTSGI